jgi:hypothetical protein
LARCRATGGLHPIEDYERFIRTWIRVQVRFFTDQGEPIHLSQPRKTTSWEMVGPVHIFYGGTCVGE